MGTLEGKIRFAKVAQALIFIIVVALFTHTLVFDGGRRAITTIIAFTLGASFTLMEAYIINMGELEVMRRIKAMTMFQRYIEKLDDKRISARRDVSKFGVDTMEVIKLIRKLKRSSSREILIKEVGKSVHTTFKSIGEVSADKAAEVYICYAKMLDEGLYESEIIDNAVKAIHKLHLKYLEGSD